MPKRFWVYIMANKPYGTLYTGVTNNLPTRIYQHRNNVVKGFTQKYTIHRLVWYAEVPTALEAIGYEKRIKKWKRDWKKKMIEQMNPTWADLYDTLS